MSTPASAFVVYRNAILAQKGIKKEASSFGDMMSGAGRYVMDNPWAVGALGGAGLGAVSGMFSDKPGSVLRRMLLGGALGAGAGGLYSHLKNPANGNPGAFDTEYAQQLPDTTPPAPTQLTDAARHTPSRNPLLSMLGEQQDEAYAPPAFNPPAMPWG